MGLASYQLRKNFNILDKYIEEKVVTTFDDELINKIKNTDVFMLRDFYQVFEEGLNIGTCGETARYLSYLFNNFTLIEDGKCEILKGTKGSPHGEHAWLLSDGYVYDTTLMLKIKEDVAYNELGYEPYKQTTYEELMTDELYVIKRRLANDASNIQYKRDLISKLKKYNLKCSLLGVN